MPQLEPKAYKVRLQVYEGPLDLLLHLIKKDELDIYEIPIERLTGQYMQHLETFKRLNIPLASEFVVMAANLMYLKSRALLPKKLQPPEEEIEENDPKWDLIRQLLEYKKFKDAALYLSNQQTQTGNLFAKQISLDNDMEVAPIISDTSVFELVRAFQKVVRRFEEENELGKIVDDHFSVSDKIEFLLDAVPYGKDKCFDSLFSKSKTKQEVIVTFLAILELVKLGKLHFNQDEMLGLIKISQPK